MLVTTEVQSTAHSAENQRGRLLMQHAGRGGAGRGGAGGGGFLRCVTVFPAEEHKASASASPKSSQALHMGFQSTSAFIIFVPFK